jgi:hypothetical protein
MISCPSGYQLETPPDGCCPICVPGASDECRNGQEQYAIFHMKLMDMFKSTACKTEKDCMLLYEHNRCVSNCGTPVHVALAKYTDQNLQSFAEQSCASCPPPLTLPCPKLPVACVKGACSLGF